MESPLELLYQAFNSAFGIIVRTEDAERLKQGLYRERKKDPDLECISICTSPTDPAHEIWLVKKEPSE